jgi:recombinational DNA repair protein RecR|tara:strand:- start:166 stop:354 length:189 start_codon:yes stop_codon:yes gene_type:complete
MPEYRHGPYSIAGAKLVTCEVCGHQHRSTHCVFCENSGDNGEWVNKIIDDQEKKEKDGKSSK